MADARFIKNKEDFKCENCGFEVLGDGYTNHCPKCLYSLHIDINPGDRASKCRGMMRPEKIEKRGKKYIIIHKCEKCGEEKKNKMKEEDNFEKIIEVVKIANNENKPK
ncbi:MAG: RNHCP domain-containing protein [Candidatus Pacebacteria bacterium]|nr:RNHCP domain-containing protein [Candidatus Paceibacterota bacterium]